MTVCNQLAPNSQNGDAIGRPFPDVLTAAQCSDSEHGPIARPPLAGVTSRTRKPHFPSRQVVQPHNPGVCGRPACVFLDSSQTNISQGVASNWSICPVVVGFMLPIPLHFAHGSMPRSVLRLGIISTVARQDGKGPFHSIRRSQWICWVAGIAVLCVRVTHQPTTPTTPRQEGDQGAQRFGCALGLFVVKFRARNLACPASPRVRETSPT